MKYHRVSAQGFKIHVSDRACAELGGEAAQESPPVKEQLAARTARMENRDYGPDCPAEEQAENAASIAAFLERCLELLHDRGRLGILLPDGNLSNPADRYIRECIAEKAAILGAVGLPPELFQPYANIKTSVLFLGKTARSAAYSWPRPPPPAATRKAGRFAGRPPPPAGKSRTTP